MDLPFKGKLAPRFEVQPTGTSWVIGPKGGNKAAKKAAKKAKNKKANASSGAGAGAGAGAATATAATMGAAAPTGTSKRRQTRQYKKSALSLDERFAVCRSVGEECTKDDELRALLARKEHPICYDGFEPSGRMHIAQGILKAINVNKLTSAGCVFKFWVADWFALLNHKMGGDLNKIRTVGRYMIEVWKAAGMDMTNVEFLWASDEINAHADEYWRRVMDIATKNTITRMQRCCTIMGRTENSAMPASQIMYPAMQCSDVFFLEADICQLGMDQRKVNVLAREYAGKLGVEHKPVILSHHMLMGLLEGQEKMSKSVAGSAIFMEDTAKVVQKKINKAFCPPATTREELAANPVLDWTRHIVFPKYGEFRLQRPEEYGGNKVYASMEELEDDYMNDRLGPQDLKQNLARILNELLEPVRKHFAIPENAALLEQVKSFRVTR